jgi:hypothetical protein
MGNTAMTAPLTLAISRTFHAVIPQALRKRLGPVDAADLDAAERRVDTRRAVL